MINQYEQPIYIVDWCNYYDPVECDNSECSALIYMFKHSGCQWLVNLFLQFRSVNLYEG
jgi:hypothetical protein